MRICPECKAQFDDEKKFCPSCGKYLPHPAESPSAPGDPVASLFNTSPLEGPADAYPPAGNGSFAEVFKKNLSETEPQKPVGNSSSKEVSWETSYINPPAPAPAPSPAPAPVSGAAAAAREIYDRTPAKQKADEKIKPVDLSEIVKREAAVMEENEVPSVGSFALSAFLLSVPLVGLIYLIALALGRTKYPAKANLAKGILLFFLIVCFILSLSFLIGVLAFDFDPRPLAESFWAAVLGCIELFSPKS